MNTPQENSKNVITLDMISQQKAEKLEEIRASKKRIVDNARQIFHPTETLNSANTLMNNFSSGMVIFNGVLTGFKIIKRIRSFFKKK